MAAPPARVRRAPGARRRRGFSLLEVIVAFVILGLFLVSILSAQGGLSASNKKAANMGLAIQFGRCKMTEIEEQTLKLGYPEIDDLKTGVGCCADDSAKFTCDTRIEKVLLPDPNVANTDGGLNLSTASSLFGADGGAASGGALGASTAINPAGGAGLSLDLDAGLAGIGNSLSSQAGGAGASGLLNMVMGIVYPSIKPMFEASIRRFTVTVHWKEGEEVRDLTLVQYATNPQRANLLGTAIDAGDPTGGIPGLPGLPGAGGSAAGPAKVFGGALGR